MTRFDSYTSLSHTDHMLFVAVIGACLALSACGDPEPAPLPDCKEVVVVEQPAEDELRAEVTAPRPAIALEVSPDPIPREARRARPAPIFEPEEEEEEAEVALHSKLEVVDYAIATSVKKRHPFGVSDHFAADEGTLWAWIQVKNRTAPSQITMVWRHEGKVRSRLTLDVGISPTWRTWSRKTIGKKDAGKWTVDVFAPDGTRLERIKFKVEAAKVEANAAHEPPTKTKGAI